MLYIEVLFYIDISFIFTSHLDHLGYSGSLFVAWATLNVTACMGVFVSNWAGTVLLVISVIPAAAPLVFTFDMSSLNCQHSCLLYLYKLWLVGHVSLQYASWRLWAGFLFQDALTTDGSFMLSMHC